MLPDDAAAAVPRAASASFTAYLGEHHPGLLPTNRTLGPVTASTDASHLAPHATTIVSLTFPGGVLMAGTVFFSVSMSLDGFIAPESLSELMGRQ